MAAPAILHSSTIPTHALAAWLLKHIDNFLNSMGLEKSKFLEELIYVAIIVGVALLLGWAVKAIILGLTRRIVRWKHTEIGEQLLKQRVFSKCSIIIPPLVLMGLLPFAFESESTVLKVCMMLLTIYTIVVVTIAINTIIRFVYTRVNAKANTKNLPLKGILYVCTGIMWIISAIIIGSVLMDKSPAVLLTGLGAFAAALMLIFKDSILGFVAGVQLSQNDMLRVGDWIVVPGTIANGIVDDVLLTAVKVRNWDNTIVTLPPYNLISSGFQNWRGMSESGYRLISRSVIFDVDSVKPLTDEVRQAVSSLPGVKEFIDRVTAKGAFYDPALACVNGSMETNLGLFRAYMCQYLLSHPLIGTDQQILVRIMVPTGEGMPLQIYCYTTTEWTAYEAVQSEIFEHVAAMAPRFGLRLYNSPSGNDVKSLAVIAERPETTAPEATVRTDTQPSGQIPNK